MEIQRAINKEEPDDVDKLLEKNGVIYNSEEELDYQEGHESGVDWDKYNEDEGDDR